MSVVLWLALYFPLLPIEALPITRTPCALVTRGRIVLADPQASAAGIEAGQRVASALGLVPELCLVERVPAREADTLFERACWAGRFTPCLSVRPAMLCLEIGGCLRLFGGLERLRQNILEAVIEQGWMARWAVAPCPQAADWLARAGGEVVCLSMAEMRDRLDALPWQVLDWPTAERARLEAFGLHRLGELRALPSAALRQRLGNGWIDSLARAYGELPDPQPPFVFPERFALVLELPARIEQAEALVFGARRLLSALSGWLNARQLQWRCGVLELRHPGHAVSELKLAVVEPTADAERLLRLLRERLSRLPLSAPVEALCLRAEEVLPVSGQTQPLFAGDRAQQGEGRLACLERLRARLGEQALQTLAVWPDHRPECASRTNEWLAESGPGSGREDEAGVAGSTGLGAFATRPGLRPTWLLPQPQALAEREGRPHWRGPLQLLTRPERIESGWWDEGESAAAGDIRRDYFVASNAQGQYAWIFRDASGWFLHGLFA